METMILSERVLFIDAEALVIDKPSGLPVDRPRDGSMSLENYLQSLTFGFQRWPLAVHRLDRDTSGCLLLARNPKAHKRYTQAFEAGTVQKRYLALLAGVPAGEEGTIDLPLIKVSTARDGWRMTGGAAGKPSRTHWRVLRTQNGQALVEFRPETGRTHQIRVHALEGLGIPVAGDPVYGDGPKSPGVPMMLHAASLTVPRGDKPAIEAVAPMPDRFIAAGFGDG